MTQGLKFCRQTQNCRKEKISFYRASAYMYCDSCFLDQWTFGLVVLQSNDSSDYWTVTGIIKWLEGKYFRKVFDISGVECQAKIHKKGEADRSKDIAVFTNVPMPANPKKGRHHKSFPNLDLNRDLVLHVTMQILEHA